MKHLFFTVLLAVQVVAASPTIDGFIIQPQLGYGGIDYDQTTFGDQNHFDAWVASMADVGVEMLFYQWTAHYWHDQGWFSSAYGTPERAAYTYFDVSDTTIDGIPFQSWGEPTSWSGGGVSPVQRGLDACEKSGVKLWLGLYLNEDSRSFNWWDAVSDGVITAEDSATLKHHAEMTLFLIDDLYRQFGSHPAFGGFYFSVEIANLAFYHEQNRDILAWLIKTVADRVHEKDPKLQLALSPFFNSAGTLEGNALGSPQEVGAMWREVFSKADLDVLILQDGVGVDPHSLDENSDLISDYYREIADACRSNDVQFWANSELFTNAGTREQPKFHSTSIEKLKHQLETEMAFADKNVSFSFQYMDPNPAHTFPAGTFMADSVDGVQERLRLYSEYRDYYNGIKEKETGIIERIAQKKSFRASVKERSLHFKGSSGDDITVEIFNAAGRRLVNDTLKHDASLNLDQFPLGIYFYKAVDNFVVYQGSFLLK